MLLIQKTYSDTIVKLNFFLDPFVLSFVKFIFNFKSYFIWKDLVSQKVDYLMLKKQDINLNFIFLKVNRKNL